MATSGLSKLSDSVQGLPASQCPGRILPGRCGIHHYLAQSPYIRQLHINSSCHPVTSCELAQVSFMLIVHGTIILARAVPRRFDMSGLEKQCRGGARPSPGQLGKHSRTHGQTFRNDVIRHILLRSSLYLCFLVRLFRSVVAIVIRATARQWSWNDQSIRRCWSVA